MKAIGVTCGIGSMLVGARNAGFDVLGNVEWRRYYHHLDENNQNTFTSGFPGAIMRHKFEDLTTEEFEAMYGADIALGHPECGAYSQLNNANKNRLDRLNDPSDIPLLVRLMSIFRPRFFVMDDLPKSFLAFPMEEYVRLLPDYDLFPEWISNWGYGNVQKMRNRMFMIGVHKSERFVFRPGERDHGLRVRDFIEDLYGREGEVPNHDPHELDVSCAKGRHLRYRGDYATWRDLAEWFQDKRGGKVVEYVNADNMLKTRPGTYKGHWDAHGHVLDGGSPALHPLRCLPLSIRERARIQGFPDDFVFYGTKKNEDGTWNHDKNLHMIKQTGKAMPIQFCQYASEQIAAHIKGEPWTCSDQRIIKPNHNVDEAKRWFCQNVGYADQEGACEACWMRDTCEIRSRVYGIGEPPDAHEPVPMDPTDMHHPATKSSEERPRAPRITEQKAKPARRVRTSRFQERGNDPSKTTIQGGGEHHEG